MNTQRVFFALFLIITMASVGNAYAMHVPFERLIFSDSQREGTLTIVNDEDAPLSFNVGWLHFRMTE
ncbi:MAG: hypothetical protein OXT65_02900, partial [Alphaproteobacteria bacterium]|nr:hypothetical protein [Alphaproteobacteria bacterium]